MKELDLLLTRYVDERFQNAPAAEQAAFHALLDVQDPVLFAYCMGQETPPDHLAPLIHRITADAPSHR